MGSGGRGSCGFGRDGNYEITALTTNARKVSNLHSQTQAKAKAERCMHRYALTWQPQLHPFFVAHPPPIFHTFSTQQPCVVACGPPTEICWAISKPTNLCNAGAGQTQPAMPT